MQIFEALQQRFELPTLTQLLGNNQTKCKQFDPRKVKIDTLGLFILHWALRDTYKNIETYLATFNSDNLSA